jgi:4-diphosphocytidyl-2-C-methyl-D-erythritol kinase
MPGPTQVHARAHAKVNLALAVGPPDATGMHPVASWMHAVDLWDAVTLAKADRTRHDLAWEDGTPVPWPAGTDLAVRAHHAAERAAGRELPALVRVRKSIPAGAGLGGGSADAAAVLLGLRDLFALRLGDAELAALGAELGSDVPFFIDPVAWDAEQPPRPAIATGRGERLERLPRRTDGVTLVLPPFGCPTGAVYRAFDDDPPGALDEARVRRLASAAPDPHALFNDLAGPAARVEPRLGEIRGALADALGGPVLVSGSGSTLFCFEPAARVAPAVPGCRVVETRLV